MNINKEAHIQKMMEIAKRFGLSSYFDEAYLAAVTSYNAGGEARSTIVISEIDIAKIEEVCPRVGTDTTVKWFCGVIKQYFSANDNGVCESVTHDDCSGWTIVSFLVNYKINISE